MTCQKCKSTAASVCVTQIVDSQKVDIYLCQNCANENAAEKLKAALGITGSMPSHLAFGAERNLYNANKDTEHCKGCGTSFADIQKSGKLGCAVCYDTFRTRLRPIITRIHRSAQHRGKSPAGAELPHVTQNEKGAGGHTANPKQADGDKKPPADGQTHGGQPTRGEESVRGEQPVRGEQSVRGEESLRGEQPVHGEESLRGEQSVRGEESLRGEQPVRGEQSLRGEQSVRGEQPGRQPVNRIKSVSGGQSLRGEQSVRGGQSSQKDHPVNEVKPTSGIQPISPPNAAQIKERLEKLKAALAEAILVEEYERAAELRDLIKAVEKKMS